MAVYIPDEKGEIAALENTALAAVDSMTQVTTTDLGASFTKMLLTLLVFVILLFGTYWFLRRIIQQKLQKGAADAAIHILEKRMLSPKTMLYLVEVEGKRVLMAESQMEIKRLETYSDPRSDT